MGICFYALKKKCFFQTENFKIVSANNKRDSEFKEEKKKSRRLRWECWKKIPRKASKFTSFCMNLRKDLS